MRVPILVPIVGCFVGMAAWHGQVQAQVLTYPVTAEKTNIVLGGNFAGLGFTEQSPDSLSGRVTGEVKAELFGSGIRLPAGGSLFTAQNLFTPQSPGSGGAAGTAPANYGLNLSVPFGTGTAAVRDLAFSLSGEALFTTSTGRGPIDSFSVTITSGTVDYDIQSALLTRSGSVSLVGTNATVTGEVQVLGEAARPGQEGTLQLLIVPRIAVPLSVVSPNDTQLLIGDRFGSIRTEFITPEPGAMALLGIGGLGMLRRRRSC